ncbi:hypothetical protein AB6A40_002384 [Gnathostoma spinigerum]|uniref:Uncharacterized protein n=1 Tax=Gnathostoma spinigerum TaxID=75299 RepID=A0ABD6EH78_9BILA
MDISVLGQTSFPFRPIPFPLFLLLTQTYTLQLPDPIHALNAVNIHLINTTFIQVRHHGIPTCAFNTRGNSTILCQCFPFPGTDYELITDNLLVQNFTVIPPKLIYSLPKTHRMLHSLNITLPSLNCETEKPQMLLYYKSSHSVQNDFGRHQLISKFNVGEKKKYITIGCESFMRPGLYYIELLNSNRFLSRSHSFTVPPSNETAILFNANAIFPLCRNYLKMDWITALCPSSNFDYRLRVFAVPEGSTVDRSYYMEELILDPNNTRIEIPCFHFDIIYKQFCFDIVAIYSRTQEVFDLNRRCIYTERLGQRDGEWSVWSLWSHCSSSCGEGTKRRYRMCSNPTPLNGGEFCKGAFIELSPCNEMNCTEYLQYASLASENNCQCNCELNEVSGSFLAMKCDDSSRWRFHRRIGNHLYIHFEKWQRLEQTFFRLYDGDAKMALLLDSRSIPSIEYDIELAPRHAVTLYMFGPNTTEDNLSGVIVSYMWYPVLDDWDYTNDIVSVVSLPLSYSAKLSLILTALLLAVFIFIAIPPIICAKISIRQMKRNSDKGLIGDSVAGHQRLDAELQCSANTDQTEITVVGGITKRSIGIQLSVSSTPRVLRNNEFTSNRGTPTLRRTPRIAHNSSSSFSTDHELEYDYYEPAMPGSFLHPILTFSSEIDIDQIIGCSSLVTTDHPKQDANTQI